MNDSARAGRQRVSSRVEVLHLAAQLDQRLRHRPALITLMRKLADRRLQHRAAMRGQALHLDPHPVDRRPLAVRTAFARRQHVTYEGIGHLDEFGVLSRLRRDARIDLPLDLFDGQREARHRCIGVAHVVFFHGASPSAALGLSTTITPSPRTHEEGVLARESGCGLRRFLQQSGSLWRRQAGYDYSAPR